MKKKRWETIGDFSTLPGGGIPAEELIKHLEKALESSGEERSND